MSTETSFTVGEAYVPGVGGHTTGGGVQDAVERANAVATEITETAGKVEDAARRLIAQETGPEARMAAAKAEGEFNMGGEPIDLGSDKGVAAMNRDIEGRAIKIDDMAKNKKSGVYSNGPTSTAKNLGPNGGGMRMGTGALTNSKLETTGFALKGAEGEEASGMCPKGKGVEKSCATFNVAGGAGRGQAMALNGPKMAPAGPGLGGGGRGAAMMAARNTISAKPAQDKGAAARAELANRDPNTPGNMSRHEYEGATARADRQGGQANPAVPGVMVAEMKMEPTGPTWSSGEKMGTGEEGLA